MLGPRPGAQKRANKLNKSGLGRSLVNQREKESKNLGTSDRYTTDITGNYGSTSALRSVTEQRPLDELLSTAELSGKDFTTERTAAIKVVRAGPEPTRLSAEDREQLVQQHYENAGKLTVPRRPHWTKSMTPEELERLEKEAFLAWRRSLASLQENPQLRLAITPFERNLEVWRQLWRVIERSDLVVQIVDARNPLLYRSEDLDNYAKSMGGKTTLLLVNKADLLSETQRRLWQDYFVSNKIPFAFFSAKEAAASLDEEDDGKPTSDILENNVKVLSVGQLETLFKQAAPEIEDEAQLQIGLVGYPNVGKSSTINALIGSKKVSVSSTPGKTKHFQTINLTKDIMLCDCPGLVFPNFAQTRADLVCQGVLPIDQLRDYLGPTSLVTDRIPRNFLERTYGIKLHTSPTTALDLLSTYGRYRGFNRTGGGEPDTSRAARIILKDYVGAKLPFSMPPPNYEGTAQEFNKEHLEVNAPDSDCAPEIDQLSLQDTELENELDQDFFKGNGDRGTASLPFHMRGSGAPEGTRANGKASKKHNKGKKARG